MAIKTHSFETMVIYSIDFKERHNYDITDDERQRIIPY